MQTLYEKESAELKRLFKEKSPYSQREFADKYNLGTPGNVWQYLNGKRALNVKIASAFAKGLGISVSDFSPRLAKEIANLQIEKIAPVEMPRLKKVPRISFVQAGLHTETGQTREKGWYIENGEYDWVDENFPDDTVTMKVQGRSMEPQFKEGDIVVVDPTLNPLPGDFVVALRECPFTDSIESTIKKYRPTGYNDNGSEVFDLVPLNPDFPTLKSDRDKCKVFGVVIEHRISFRRRK